MRAPSFVSQRLRGPLPILPRPLDAVNERWATLSSRTRLLAAVAALALAVGLAEARVQIAEARWGGTPVDVLVATSDLGPGADLAVRGVTFPPGATPPGAVTTAPAGATLALALPEGAVLTEAHLDPAGPAAGLGDDVRVVPFPVESGWGVTAGGWVDVWVLGLDDVPATEVARARPVLKLTADDAGRATALVGLDVEEVGPATAGIAAGRVLLAHAPAP